MKYDDFFEKYSTIILFATIIAAASISAYFFFSNQGYWWDEAVYLGLAKNLYDGKGYYINENQESFRPPLFPYMIFFLWKIFGQSELIVKIIPPLFSIFSVIATYILAEKIYGKQVATWSSLIIATNHQFLFYSLKLLSETIFMTFFAFSLCLLYLGFEKNRKMLIFAGVAMGLTFLTRYMGYVMPVIYASYPAAIWLKDRKHFPKIFSDKFYWLGAFLFVLVLAPWLWMSYVNFGSPLGALFAESSTVTTGWYIEGWSYYFAHWIEIFGPVGLFALPAAIYAAFKIKDPRNVFIILAMAAIILFFTILPRKEMRYIVSFLPVFALFFALGSTGLGRWFRKNRLFAFAVLFFCALNFITGTQRIQDDMQGGYALKEAGTYLSGIVPEGGKIMSQNMPVLFYTAGRDIAYFPENESGLAKAIADNNVKFIVIEKREPTYPSYVWVEKDYDKTPSSVFTKFKLEKTFQENNETFVWVYRV